MCGTTLTLTRIVHFQCQGTRMAFVLDEERTWASPGRVLRSVGHVQA